MTLASPLRERAFGVHDRPKPRGRTHAGLRGDRQSDNGGAGSRRYTRDPVPGYPWHFGRTVGIPVRRLLPADPGGQRRSVDRGFSGTAGPASGSDLDRLMRLPAEGGFRRSTICGPLDTQCWVIGHLLFVYYPPPAHVQLAISFGPFRCVTSDPRGDPTFV